MTYLPTIPHTGAEIKTLYEAEANAFTDTKDTKLSGLTAGANTITLIAVAGDTLKGESLGEIGGTGGNSYDKVKEVTVPLGYKTGAVFRIKFKLRNSGSLRTTYGKIYISGVNQDVTEESHLGVELSNEYTHDVAADAGDTIELWVKRDGTGFIPYGSNFKICSTDTGEDYTWIFTDE